ncbi:MAG: hypothetical protein IBX52_03900, partial [Bacterioplanes sp.]|nr:hypothetical protein [Bacterioplanes sp.]
MWKKVRNLAVLASVATSALIVGCQPVQPMDTGFQPVTLTYEYNVGSATTSVDDIYDKLVEAIVGAVTVMPPTQIIPGETDILTVRGQEAKSTCISVGNCTINVSYVNGKFYRSTGSKYLTTQTISIPVKISKNGQVFNAIVELDGTVDTVSEGGFLGASPLLNA